MKKSIADSIQEKIKKHKISMRPKSYFTLGAIAMGAGLTLLTFLSILFVSLISFKMRLQKPFSFLEAGSKGIDPFLGTFPWIPLLLALAAITGGIVLMKKYEFSYKHAFWGLGSGFLITIIGFGIIADATNLSSRAHDIKELRPLFVESYANGTWVTGSVEKIDIPTIHLKTPRGKQFTVIITENTEIKPPTDIMLNEWLKVIGEKDSEQFEAVLIFHNEEPRGAERLFMNHGFPKPPRK